MRTLGELLTQGYRFERSPIHVTVLKPDGTKYLVKPSAGSYVCNCWAGQNGRLCCHIKAVETALALAGEGFIFCPVCGCPMTRREVNGFRYFECPKDIGGHSLDARLVDEYYKLKVTPSLLFGSDGVPRMEGTEDGGQGTETEAELEGERPAGGDV